MTVFKIFTYEHFFLKTEVQISKSAKVDRLISNELHEKKNWISIY